MKEDIQHPLTEQDPASTDLPSSQFPTTLPALALLPNSAKALREHRKRHVGEYEKVVRHKAGLSRYYSDEPSVCVGQWVLSQFTPPETQWVLFYPITNKENERTAAVPWYGLHTLSGQVQREYIGTLESLISHFAFECNQSERVYIPSQAGSEYKGDAEEHEPLAPLIVPGLVLPPDKLGVASTINLSADHLTTLPKRYLTQSTGRWQRPALVGMVCLCLTGLGAWLALMNTPAPIVQQETVDPLSEWFTQLTQAPHASPTLSLSETLLSQSRLLPHDYNAQALTLSSEELVLQINSARKAPNRNTLKLWQQQNTVPGSRWDSSASQLHVTAPLAPQDMTVSVLGLYPDKLYEQLRLLGSVELSLNQNPNLGQIESWRLNGEFTDVITAMLSNIATLTANKPVFIRELTLTPHENGRLNVKFSLLILGVTP